MGTPKSNAGDIAQLQETNRRNLIGQGTGQINRIFDGGTYGTGVAGWNPKNRASLYDPSGMLISNATTANDPGFAAWVKSHPNVSKASTTRNGTGQFLYRAGQIGEAGGGSGFNLFNPLGIGEDRKTLSLDDIRNLYGKFLGGSGDLFSGTATSPGFGPDFYNKRATDYINYAMPQLQQQAGQESKALQYKLANQGLTKSSAGQRLGSSLLQAINQQRQGVASSAVQQSQDLQKQVEGQRSNLISQLEVSADPGAASASAIRTAAGFQAPSQFQPLGNLFSNWANTYLASQVPTSNPSLLPYLYGLPGSRSASPSFIPGNSVN